MSFAVSIHMTPDIPLMVYSTATTSTGHPCRFTEPFFSSLHDRDRQNNYKEQPQVDIGVVTSAFLNARQSSDGGFNAVNALGDITLSTTVKKQHYQNRQINRQPRYFVQ